jgi:putative addiction module component
LTSANVPTELLASLDEAEAEHPVEVEAARAAEIERRARRVVAGITGIPWEDVRRRA